MATHSNHPTFRTDGLSDDCDRCAEIAEHPFETMDADNILRLLTMTRAFMQDDFEARSRAELAAIRKAEDFLGTLDRLQMFLGPDWEARLSIAACVAAVKEGSGWQTDPGGYYLGLKVTPREEVKGDLS